MQSQALSVTRPRCGPGGYIQVGMRGCVLIDAPHRHFIVVGGKLKYCYPGSLPRGGEAPLPAPDNNLMACVLLPAAAAFWPHEFGGAWARGGLGDDLSWSYLGGTRGEGLKPGSSCGDFREREGCGCKG